MRPSKQIILRSKWRKQMLDDAAVVAFRALICANCFFRVSGSNPKLDQRPSIPPIISAQKACLIIFWRIRKREPILLPPVLSPMSQLLGQALGRSIHEGAAMFATYRVRVIHVKPQDMHSC